MVDATLMYGIVTYISELSQNLAGMNEKFWAVWVVPESDLKFLTATFDGL